MVRGSEEIGESDVEVAMERRLAVILSADAVSYSRIMERDEDRAHRALRKRHAIVESLSTRRGGRVFSGAGDSIMVVFASAVEAVQAAVEIQSELSDIPLDLPDGEWMQFRIGINLGDVIVDGSNLYGDGVNLAARLEALAEPGGICIAANVHEHVENKLPLSFRDGGLQTVKNISRPVHVYQVSPRTSDDGLLSVTSVEGFATNWLAPRLALFERAHPNITVRLEAAGNLVDFMRDGFDLGIRTGRGDWPDLNAHPLRPIEFTPLISPGLLRELGGLRKPEDLARAPLLDDREGWWSQWLHSAGAGDVQLPKSRSFQVITQTMACQAVLAGQYVALLSPFLFQPELTSGRLVQPFDHVHRSELGYWLVYPKVTENVGKVRAFRDWLLGETAKG